MAAIAERLLQAETTAAPSVDLVKNCRILDCNWTWYGRDRLHSLISPFARILLFDLSLNLDVEVRLILVVERHSGILGLDDPTFRLDVFYFFEEEGTPANQHNLILFTTEIN